MTMEVFGREYVYASKLMNDFFECNHEFCSSLAKKSHSPIQVIFAGAGDLVKYNDSYDVHARESRKDVIEEATHLFSEQDCAGKLCELTEDWFRKK